MCLLILELSTITSKQDIVKEAYASLVALYTIASRHCLDGSSLSQNVQTLVLANTDRLPEIVKIYEAVNPHLTQVCKITSTSLANVVDVECRLDYCVQVSYTILLLFVHGHFFFGVLYVYNEKYFVIINLPFIGISGLNFNFFYQFVSFISQCFSLSSEIIFLLRYFHCT